MAGLAWSPWFPVNKSLWSSSYVLLTGGIACQALAACYWVIDVQGRDRWAWPGIVLGTNALFAFVLSGILARLILLWQVATPAGDASAKRWLFEQVLVPLAGPMTGSLLFALTNVALMLAVTWLLYRRRIFLKL